MPAQMVMATNMFILNTLAALAASRKGRKVKMAMEMAMMVLNVGAEESKPSAMKMQMSADRKPQPARAGTMGLKIAATVSKKRVSSLPFLSFSSSFRSGFTSMGASSSTPVCAIKPL